MQHNMADTDAPSQQPTEHKRSADSVSSPQGQDRVTGWQSWNSTSPRPINDDDDCMQQRECGNDMVTMEHSGRTDLINGIVLPRGGGVGLEPVLASPSSQTEHPATNLRILEEPSTEEAASVGWQQDPGGFESGGKARNWRLSPVAPDGGLESMRRGEHEDSSPCLSLSLSSTSSQQESGTVGVGSYHSDVSCSLTLSQQQAIGYNTSITSSLMSSVGDPPSTVQEGQVQVKGGGGRYETIAESVDEPDTQRTCNSPFLVVGKSDVTDVSQFESPGMLYASTSSKQHNRWVSKFA